MEKIPKNSIVYLTQNRETYDEIVRVLHSYSKIQCHRITDISGPELLSVLGIQSIPLNWDNLCFRQLVPINRNFSINLYGDDLVPGEVSRYSVATVHFGIRMHRLLQSSAEISNIC